ncbi:MAG: hypothetical protein ACKVQA_03305 [Burkholderiales bacterium]
MRNAIEQFRAAIHDAGLHPPEVIEPNGKLHRFASNGKRGDDAGWYVFHDDGIPAGVFGDWRTGDSQTWRADIGRTLTLAEDAAHRAKVEAMRRQREADLARERAEAAKKAKAIWKAATEANADHPYLVRKTVLPVPTLREISLNRAVEILGYSPKSKGEPLMGRLLVVPVKIGDALSTCELIDEAGRKSALFGGAKTGGYWAAQPLPGDEGERLTLQIGEGAATVLSAREATGYPSIASLSGSNLLGVARAMRARYPAAVLVILADLLKDSGESDPHAIEAARAVGGKLAIPGFGPERPQSAKDMNDLAVLHGVEAVRRSIETAQVPAVTEHRAERGNSPAGDCASPEWPKAMDPAALHGIAGDFVRMVEPNTEADPAAILIQFLVAFGALVGRGPHYLVERDQHHANLYVLLVGETSKARKGTSWSRVRDVFANIQDWKPHVSGLSSGEGLKYHVRDERKETGPNKRGEVVTETLDTGVTDKRLLVMESEFASALRNAQRPSNTLSATIREGWDSGTLRTLTKNDPITATDAHICIIGHITAEELRAELTATDSANGFANRFLFVGVKRSKLLPHGGDSADPGEAKAIAERVRELAMTAKTRQRVTMTPAARKMWEAVYPALSFGGDGLHGAVTARAEAQVIRLALVYCLLDGADQIEVLHIEAALAVWEYCDATAKHVFGASLGDRIADEIMRALQQAGDRGLSRTAIRDLFGRNQSAERIGAALELLHVKGRATCDSIKTEGRPTEVWKAAK